MKKRDLNIPCFINIILVAFSPSAPVCPDRKNANMLTDRIIYSLNSQIRGILILIPCIFLFGQLAGQVNFTYKSEFSYLRGKDASSIPAQWMNSAFDYSSWEKGNAPFRYGDGTGGVELSDMMNNYSTVYLRSAFTCLNSSLIKEIRLTVDYDDGYILWINGRQVASRNAPGSPSPSSLATASHESGTGEVIIIPTSSLPLTDGINFIAVQGFNVSLTSSDFYFDLQISAEIDLPPFPGTDTLVFSYPSGFYDAPFTVTINSADQVSSLYYTLDCSNPKNSPTARTATLPVSIPVDPASGLNRPVTPGFIVRASLHRAGYKPSEPATRSYIFADKVKTQSYPGGAWPQGSVNGQSIDLDSDPDIAGSPEYSPYITNSLKYIPTVSVVTDLPNLFDPVTGIYVNAFGHGLNWERDCNVELLNPDGSAGFNTGAGLRIRGGWSRHSDFPKHSFRLFFREEYGSPKLKFPLFDHEGAASFDKIDLRCEQNYAWSTGNPFNSLVREVFSRDLQGDLGQPYSRSRACHLYLNGMYWGVYQTEERPEARFAKTYLGGDVADYDVVKVNIENWAYTIEATDGNLESWNRLWNLCNSGFVSNENYFRLEGKDRNGNPVKGGEIMVDIDNLIDYMLVIFYSGNFDAPTSSFMGNKGCNNFYAIDDRTDRSGGFTFYIHDSEHSLFDEAHSPGIGIYEDRVNIGLRIDDMKMLVDDLSRFHPQWLHYKLSANQEYLTRFADRAYSYFLPGGPLTSEKGIERLEKRVSEVDLAVIAESLRWGDALRPGDQPYTRNSTWLPEIDKIRQNFLPYRSPILIAQLKSAWLYPQIAAPKVSCNNVIINDPVYKITSDVRIDIVNPVQGGTVCYTLDGSDPRKTGGEISPRATISSGDFSISIKNSELLSSRIYCDGKWSALVRIRFIDSREKFSDFRITEIHYHPPDLINGKDTVSGTELEFIEFKNTGLHSVNLGGLKIDSAITYAFPENILLAPGSFYVVASDRKEFYNIYGMNPSGIFSGHFSNSGERILVEAAENKTIFDFRYSDEWPWPQEVDGTGYSLSSGIKNPSGDPGNPNYWIKSSVKGGTPFADNTTETGEDPDSSGIGPLLLYPNPTQGIINLELKTEPAVIRLDLTVYNIYGNAVKKMSVANPAELDLNSWNIPGGLYVLECRSEKYCFRKKVLYLK
jgi:hypothetical protein